MYISMSKELTEQQRKKKEYNKKYLERLKEKAITDALKGNTEKKEEILQDNDADFFFRDKKPTSPIQMTKTREPVPVVIQQATTPLKQKLLETLALSAISMIPLLLKNLLFYKSSTQSSEVKPQNTPQPQQKESANYSPGMNLL